MATKFWGELSSVNTDLVTIDNISIVDILYNLDTDMQYYQETLNNFWKPFVTETDKPNILVKYYDSAVQNYSEGGRPENELTQYDFTQEIGYNEKQAQITLTERAVRMMTADQLGAVVQSKLTGFMTAMYSTFRKVVFSNTTISAIDTIGKYRTETKPFYNFPTAIDDLWPSPAYNFVSGDGQHYNGVATVNTLTPLEIRTKLIDKVRHHGFKQIEIWVNEFDYEFENLGPVNGQQIFIPAENQIGRNVDLQTGADTGRTRALSPFEGLVGFVYNTPVIKTRLVPTGYAVAIGTDGGPGRTPFLSRKHPIPGLDGLQVNVHVETFPLQNTVMTEGWGFAPYHRGAIAVLDLKNLAYTVPANL